MNKGSLTNYWQDVLLGDVIEIYDHKRIPLSGQQRKQRQGIYPYYGASGVIDHIDDYIFDGRYLLVAEDGENLNSRKLPIAFFASGKFWVNNHAHIIRGKDGVSDDYFLMSYLQASNISGFITGAAQPKLSQANLKAIKLKLPPLQVQKEISGILSAYDDLIENNTRRIRILEEMAQTLYREWFVHFRFPGHEEVKFVESPLGKIPKDWEVKRLQDVCTKISAGGTPARKDESFWENGPIEWFKTKELNDNFLFSSEERITADGLDKSSAKLFERGTLLMAIYAAPTVGRLGILTRPGSCNQAAVGFMTDINQLSNTALFYILISLRGHFNSISQGAAQQNISKEKVASTKFVLPNKSLLDIFEVQIQPIWQLLENLQKTNITLRQTRDILLPKLISGEICQ